MEASLIDIELGVRIRARRRKMGLRLVDVAARSGVNFRQIQKYETATNSVSASTLWQLAQALEVPVSYFYDGLGEPA